MRWQQRFLFLFICFTGIMIPRALLAREKPAEYFIEKFGKESGFNYRAVEAIEFDKAGVLWLCADGKLISMAGKQFIQHNFTSGPLSKSINQLSFFVKDKYGNLYCRNNNYTYKITGDQKVYFYMDSHFGNDLRDLISTEMYPNLFKRLGGYNYHWRLASNIARRGSNAVILKDTSLYIHEKSKVTWLCTYKKNLFSEIAFADKRYFFTNQGIDCIYNNGKIIEGNDLWLDGQQKLQFKPETVRIYNKEGRLFLSCDLGLFQVKEKSNKLHATLLIDSTYLKNLDLTDVLPLEGGEVFLLATSHGLYQCRKKKFTVFNKQEPTTTSSNSIYSFQNNLYINNGYCIDDKGNQLSFRKFAFNDYADDYEFFNNGTVALNSVAKFEVADSSLRGIYKSEDFAHTSCLLKHSDGTIYLFNIDGIWKVSEKGLFKNVNRFSTPHLFESVFTVIQVQDTFYIGTEKGLFKIAMGDNIKLANPLLKGLPVKHLQMGPKREGVYAFTDGGGVFLLKNQSVLSLFIDKNDYLRNAHYIIPDAYNRYWIPTNVGMFVFSAVDWIYSSSIKNYKPMYFYFEGPNLNNPTEYNGTNNHAWYTHPRDNFILLCSVNGLVQFHPKEIPTRIQPHDMVIHATSFMEDKYDGLQQPPVYFETMTLLVGVPYFGSNQNFMQEYQLDGTHDLWHNVSEKGEVVLSRNHTGLQKLKLRYRYGLGPNDYHYTEFYIYVIPFWYETYWFYGFLGLLFLSIFWLFLKYRQKKLIQKQKILESIIDNKTTEIRLHLNELQKSEEKLRNADLMKEKLIKVLAHDIRSPLISAYYVSNKMSSSESENGIGKENKLMIDQVSQTIRSVYEYASDFLVWYNLQQGNQKTTRVMLDVSECMNQVLDFYTAVIASTGNFLELDIEENVTLINDSKALSIIFRNLIDNANKYSSHSLIKVQLVAEEDFVMVSFENESKNLSPEIRQFMLHRLTESFDNNEANEGEWLGLRMVAFFGKVTHSKIDLEFPSDSKVKFIVKVPYN